MRRIITILCTVGVDVDVAEDSRDIVGEDLGEYGWRKPLGGVVEMECSRQARDAIRNRSDRSHVMGHDDDREIELFVECVDELAEALLTGDVDADHGFIEDEEFGLDRDGTGNHRPLELPA